MPLIVEGSFPEQVEEEIEWESANPCSRGKWPSVMLVWTDRLLGVFWRFKQFDDCVKVVDVVMCEVNMKVKIISVTK